MRTDRDRLLRSVLIAPGEDAARLVFADALEESGRVKRAEFIRTSIYTGVTQRYGLCHAVPVAECYPRPYPMYSGYGASMADVSRGFVGGITTRAREWTAVREVFLRHPVTRLYFLNSLEWIDPIDYGNVRTDRMPDQCHTYLSQFHPNVLYNNLLFATEAEHKDALSIACADWWREELGLPPQWGELVPEKFRNRR